MPDYSTGGLLGMMGYDAGSLQELFGQYFEKPEAKWSQYLEPAFGSAGEALGELPGQRRSMLGQLTSGLQERGVASRRGLQARRAGAGFAGAGALDRLGRTARRGIQQEYGRGRWDIGQNIARREAGILGVLGGKTETFLQRLRDEGVKPAGEGGEYYQPTTPGVGESPWDIREKWADEEAGILSFDAWKQENALVGSESWLRGLYDDYVSRGGED